MSILCNQEESGVDGAGLGCPLPPPPPERTVLELIGQSFSQEAEDLLCEGGTGISA